MITKIIVGIAKIANGVRHTKIVASAAGEQRTDDLSDAIREAVRVEHLHA